MPNVQRQKTRKESVAADFDLVTIAAYNNFSTRTPRTSQPQPDFQDCESRNSQNFNPENFFFLLGEQTFHSEMDRNSEVYIPPVAE